MDRVIEAIGLNELDYGFMGWTVGVDGAVLKREKLDDLPFT